MQKLTHQHWKGKLNRWKRSQRASIGITDPVIYTLRIPIDLSS